MRSRGPTGRASIRAADDVLETGRLNEEILACFEEALGDQLPEMGTDAAAGREANADGAEAARRLEAAAEQQRGRIFPCLHQRRRTPRPKLQS